MYEIQSGVFSTPRGSPVEMLYRAGTNDYSTLLSCLTEDEYGLRDLLLSDVALDIGAYIGGVAVALAIDNPELTVVAVEPVPSNVELLQQNVALNGLEERVFVLDGALGDGTEVVISHSYSGSESACHHAFVGNATLIGDYTGEAPHEERTLQTVRLDDLRGDDPISLLKVDCEGCEWTALLGADLSRIARIHGEWHPTNGHTMADLNALLEPTHVVTFTGPQSGPGGFQAVRR
jgi:FkbM family methyltransferase